MGRQEELHPERKNADNPIEIWTVKAVRPNAKGGKPVKFGSIGFTSKSKAEACYDRQDAKGFNPVLVQSFIAGWV